MRKSSSVAVVLGLGAALLWGLSGAVVADAFSEVSPLDAAQARATIAAVALLPLAWKRRALRHLAPPWILLAFGVSLAAVHFLYYFTVERLGVGPGITIQFLAPIMVLGWMRAVEGRNVSRQVWIAAMLAVVGTGLIARIWDVDTIDWLGVIAGLGSAVLFAAYLLLGEHLGRTMKPSGIMAIGFAVAAVLWVVVQPPWLFPTDVSGRVWLELLWLGIGGTALPFMMELAAIQHASAGTVGVIATAEPVIGAIAAWLWLGQAMAMPQVLGMLLIVIAVAAVQRWGVAEFEVPLDAGR